MKKTLMAHRWKLRGFYRHMGSMLSWQFQRKYSQQDVIWEFGEGILTSYYDDRFEYSVRCLFFKDDLISIHFPGISPFLHYNVKRYLVVKKKNSPDIWLYDTDRSEMVLGFELAIRLSPIE